MKIKYLLFVGTALCSLFTAVNPAFAQGTAFTYQGRLNDGTNPASGTYDLRFALFDAASSGAQIGSAITNSALAISGGIYTVTLDYGAGVFTGANRWLDMSVRTNGGGAFTPLIPRNAITPTPYAIYSANAGSATTATTAASATSAGSFTGSLAGDVTGTQGATVVGSVGGQSAANVAGGASAANAATSANTANTIVKRDASGNFNAGKITGTNFSGNGAELTNLTATNLTGAIAPANIGAGTITSTMLAAGSVTSNQLAAGSVTTSSLADGAVSLDKLTTVVVGPVSITFTNPTPASSEEVGVAVTAVGTDKVLIGAWRNDTGATDAGAAYLFSSSGMLLTTFTNPTPAASDYFGFDVTAVGTDRVLIGAYQDDTGATDAGAAYLFNTNGTLLTTFTNPTPAASDYSISH